MSGRTEGGATERGTSQIGARCASRIPSRPPFRSPRLRRQNRRPVPRLAAERPLARSQGQRHFQKHLRRRLRRRETEPQTARPRPARREAQDAAEAASGRVRLARRLFRRKDGCAPSTSGGRTREAANAKTLAAIEKRYGVPGEVLLAIWGRETGFGAAKMPYDAFEVLGTKAFMSTKKDFFRTEAAGGAGDRRAWAGAGRRHEIVLGRRARPAAIHADLLPQTCRRFRRRWPPRHLEFDAGRAGLDRQLSRPLWLGEGPWLGFRGDGARERFLLARRPRPGQENLRAGRRWASAASAAKRFRRAN